MKTTPRTEKPIAKIEKYLAPARRKKLEWKTLWAEVSILKSLHERLLLAISTNIIMRSETSNYRVDNMVDKLITISNVTCTERRLK